MRDRARLDDEGRLRERSFFYLPFEHSEALADQKGAIVAQSRLPADADALKSGRDSCRYHPLVLWSDFRIETKCWGRVTTPEEQAFLDGGGFAG